MDTDGINVPDRSPDGSTDVATRMNFDGEAIEGADNPKIVDWEDLQQELARLWSLSSALGKAKERKASLARRLESIIEVGFVVWHHVSRVSILAERFRL